MSYGRYIVRVMAIGIAFAFGQGNALGAEGSHLINGAGTLGRGTVALTSEFGVDLPAPMLYAVRADYGVLDRLQIGLRSSYFSLEDGHAFSAGLLVGATLWESTDGRHLLGARLNPQYLNWTLIADLRGLYIDPTALYELRLGAGKRAGLYVKLGTAHVFAKLGSNTLNLFDNKAANQTFTGNLFRTGVGFQAELGRHFALSAEGNLYTRLRFNRAKPFGAIALTYAF